MASEPLNDGIDKNTNRQTIAEIQYPDGTIYDIEDKYAREQMTKVTIIDWRVD